MNEDIKRGDIDSETHPVATRRYTVITPMLSGLAGWMQHSIRNGITGAIVQGEPRRGKTKARRFLAGALTQFFPRMPVYSLIARQYTHPSERVFFGDLLRAFSHSLYSSGTAAQRRDRLLEGAVSAVQASGQSRIVLFIDQAHCLLELHYHWLVDFHDELSERGIELFVFLFGQPELSAMREELRRAGKTQILGRFMADSFKFYGIRNLKEIEACMRVYDDAARYPEGSSWTFSRYYFTAAYDGGWRLARCASLFWAAYDNVRRRGAICGPMEIPMLHFVRAIERFLLEGKMNEALPDVRAEYLEDIIGATMFGSGPKEGEGEDEPE